MGNERKTWRAANTIYASQFNGIKEDILMRNTTDLYDLKVFKYFEKIAKITVTSVIDMDKVGSAQIKNAVSAIYNHVSPHSSHSVAGLLYKRACAEVNIPMAFMVGSAPVGKSLEITDYTELLHIQLLARLKLMHNEYNRTSEGKISDRYITNLDRVTNKNTYPYKRVAINSGALSYTMVSAVIKEFRPVGAAAMERAVKFIATSKEIVVTQEVTKDGK